MKNFKDFKIINQRCEKLKIAVKWFNVNDKNSLELIEFVQQHLNRN